VARALSAESRGRFTVTARPGDADVTVYVLAEVVKPEDHAAIRATGRPVLTVLNKADLIATTAPGRHPQGPTAAADAWCARLSARTGVPVEPLVALLAVAGLDDESWQALTAGHEHRLLGTLDIFGTRQAGAAIRQGATRADVDVLLHTLSNIDAVVARIDAFGAQIRYRRMTEAVAELEAMAVADRRIGEFLARDDTVVARMVAALDVVEAVGGDAAPADTAAVHLRRALRWQRRLRDPATATQRACGADIVRGSLRLWTKAGGTV
jgi:hypothetical protein